MRRARLPVAMSEGFHPKPRVSYLSALPLGFSSEDESMELILEEDLPASELCARLNAASVPGLEFLRTVALVEKSPKQQAVSFSYAMTYPAAERGMIQSRIDEFFASESVEVVKSNGKVVEARPHIQELILDGDTLRMTIASQDGPEVGVREMIGYLGLESHLFRTIFPTRTRSRIADEVDSSGEESSSSSSTSDL